MNEYHAQNQEKQWACTTALIGIYGNTRTLEDLSQASKRLVKSGITHEAIASMGRKIEEMTANELMFWDGMNRRRFSVEQMMAFLIAPRQANAFSQRTREQISSEIMRNWKPLRARVVSETGARLSAASSLIVLAGVVAGSSLHVYSLAANDPIAQETATILTQVFPDMVQKVLDRATQSMIGIGALTTTGAWVLSKMGKAIIERRSAVAKAKHVDLEKTLAQQVEPDSVVSAFQGYEETKSRLNDITLPQRHLLTHLDGNELRLFLHGNDDLRRQILVSRPPSYSQRLSYIHASDATLFHKWIDELMLAGTPWQKNLGRGPARLQDNLANMRKTRTSSEGHPRRSSSTL